MSLSLACKIAFVGGVNFGSSPSLEPGAAGSLPGGRAGFCAAGRACASRRMNAAAEPLNRLSQWRRLAELPEAVLRMCDPLAIGCLTIDCRNLCLQVPVLYSLSHKDYVQSLHHLVEFLAGERVAPRRNPDHRADSEPAAAGADEAAGAAGGFAIARGTKPRATDAHAGGGVVQRRKQNCMGRGNTDGALGVWH